MMLAAKVDIDDAPARLSSDDQANGAITGSAC
jgi:hypothetical protein